MTTTIDAPVRSFERTIAAIRTLTDAEVTALVASSRAARKTSAPGASWPAVQAADPGLAARLDELHAAGVEADMPRFDALAADHERALANAVKGATGKTITALVWAGLLAAAAAISTFGQFLAGHGGPEIAIAMAVCAAVPTAVVVIMGRILGRRHGNWLLSDASIAAGAVWDAGIDAAAAEALKGAAAPDGITPAVLEDLSSVWTGAGLDPSRLSG